MFEESHQGEADHRAACARPSLEYTEFGLRRGGDCAWRNDGMDHVGTHMAQHSAGRLGAVRDHGLLCHFYVGKPELPGSWHPATDARLGWHGACGFRLPFDQSPPESGTGQRGRDDLFRVLSDGLNDRVTRKSHAIRHSTPRHP